MGGGVVVVGLLMEFRAVHAAAEDSRDERYYIYSNDGN
jgi:hypothetical protein